MTLPSTTSTQTSLALTGAVSFGLLVGCGGGRTPAVTGGTRSQASEFVGSAEATLVGPARAQVKAPNVPDQSYAHVRLLVKPHPTDPDPAHVVLEFDHGPFAGCPIAGTRDLSGIVAKDGEACTFIYAGRDETRQLEAYVRKLAGGDDVTAQVKADLENAVVGFTFKGKRKP